MEGLAKSSDTCLIIDGQSLQTMLDRHSLDFITICLRLPVVICCRCAPTQKAEIVRLINTNTTKRTCAIGDGGNDVSMIQMAHLGIGVVGKEGMQASLAADFSITQFKHIVRLLLWHGRNSYKRTAKLAHFVIHRGLIIAVMQAVFSSLFYFAPIALYQVRYFDIGIFACWIHDSIYNGSRIFARLRSRYRRRNCDTIP